MKNLFDLAAVDLARGRISASTSTGLPTSAPRKGAAERHPAVAFAGAVALLGAGAIAAVFIIGGEQLPAAATDAPQLAASTAAPQILPTRKVRTTRIEIAPRLEKAEPQPAVSAGEPATAEIPPLPQDDPRWAVPDRNAQTDSEPQAAERSEAGQGDPLDGAETSAGVKDPADAARPGEDLSTDPFATAAISRNKERELERALSPVAVEAFASVPDQPDADDAAPTRTERVNTAVNMRARPADEAKVVMVIPAKASVGVIGCKGWCEITYKGNRGFIYKSFIGRAKAARKASAKPAPAAAAPKPEAEAAAPETAQAKVGIWNKIRDNR